MQAAWAGQASVGIKPSGAAATDATRIIRPAAVCTVTFRGARHILQFRSEPSGLQTVRTSSNTAASPRVVRLNHEARVMEARPARYHEQAGQPGGGADRSGVRRCYGRQASVNTEGTSRARPAVGGHVTSGRANRCMPAHRRPVGARQLRLGPMSPGDDNGAAPVRCLRCAS